MPKDSDPAAPEWAPGSCPWVNTILPDPCTGLEAVDPFGWVVLWLARRRMGRGRMKWGATPLLAMCWLDCRSKREGRQGGLSVIAGSEAGTRELVSCGAQGQMPKLTGFLEKWVTCFPYLPGEQGLGRNLEERVCLLDKQHLLHPWNKLWKARGAGLTLGKVRAYSQNAGSSLKPPGRELPHWWGWQAGFIHRKL